MKVNKKIQGQKNKKAGARFELKVRKDLESKGWIVDKWSNNVEFGHTANHDGSFTPVKWKDLTLQNGDHYPGSVARMVKVKNKFLGPGKPMMLGAGFPDFISFTNRFYMGEIHVDGNLEIPLFATDGKTPINPPKDRYVIIGVEVKSNGYLDKIEKEKCKWLLDNNIFSKILIASKGKKRGEIIYNEFILV